MHNGFKPVMMQIKTAGVESKADTGGFVVLKVIEKKDNNLYEVRIGSKIVTIKSELPLESGIVLHGKLEQIIGTEKMLFKLIKPHLPEAGFIVKPDLHGNEIVLNQFNNKIKNLPDRFKKAIEKLPKDIQTIASALEFADKGIEPDSSLISGLLSFFVENHNDKENGLALDLFNILESKNQNWKLYPIQLKDASVELKGLLSCCFRPKTDILLLFNLHLKTKAYELCIFADQSAKKMTLVFQGDKNKIDTNYLIALMKSSGYELTVSKDQSPIFDLFHLHDAKMLKNLDVKV